MVGGGVREFVNHMNGSAFRTRELVGFNVDRFMIIQADQSILLNIMFLHRWEDFS